MLKLNGFVFLLRMMIYQVIIAGINKMGMFASIMLLMTEIGFLVNNLKNYIRFKHFRKRIMIVGKIAQGTCMTVFMFILVLIADKNIKSVEPVAVLP